MDDVLGEIVLTRGNEDLGARHSIAAIRLLPSASIGQSDITSGMSLGEVHRTSCLAGNEIRHISRLDLIRGVREQRCDGSLGQAAIHVEGKTRGGEELPNDRAQGFWQALSSVLLGRGYADPTACGLLLIGLAESLRRRNGGIRL